MTTNFDFKGSRRLGKEEICTKGVSDSKKKKKKEEGWSGRVNILPFFTLHQIKPNPNQTWLLE